MTRIHTQTLGKIRIHHPACPAAGDDASTPNVSELCSAFFSLACRNACFDTALLSLSVRMFYRCTYRDIFGLCPTVQFKLFVL